MKAVKFFSYILLVVLLMGSFSGCGSRSKTLKLTDTIGTIHGLEDYKPASVLAEKYMDNVEYTVTDVSWDGEKGIADVEVMTPDLKQILEEAITSGIEKYGTDDYATLLDNIEKDIEKTLESGDVPMQTSTIQMDAEKGENNYNLVSNNVFEMIISGNLSDVLAQMYGE